MDPISVRKMRKIEEKAFASGITVLELMERAGSECAKLIESKMGTGKKILIFCGPGNNGGDGLVCARYLQKKNEVAVVIPIEPKTEAAKANLERARKAGIRIEQDIPDESLKPDIVIDALLGIGASGPLRGNIRELCRTINRLPGKKISIDVKSGADLVHNKLDEDSVRADAVICIHAPKAGQDSGEELWVADIGLGKFAIE